MLKLVLATHNKGKLAEMRDILAPYGYAVLSPDECGITEMPEETGATFEENALIKARNVCARSGLAALADDSGLEVDALGGAPGVYSARYGHPRAKTDGERNTLLLQNLENVPKSGRGARFVCCIALVWPDGREETTEGVCPGVIASRPRGAGGFGYDPLFYLPEFGATMAEITPEQKNKISHRGRALRALCAMLAREEGQDK